MIWTPATIAKMYALLDEGLSWSAVGERMGCSKGCIAGKLRRLGQRPRPASEPVPLPAPPWLPGVSACQYPYGHPREPGFRYCGEIVWRGVYCRACFARCYQHRLAA